MSASAQRCRSRAGAALRSCASASPGFTIVEVLVATLILTIGIVALMASFTSSQKVGTRAEAHQTAVALAEGELERLHGLSWENLGLTSGEVPARGSGVPASYEAPSPSETCTGNGDKPLEANCYQWNWKEASTREPLVEITAAEAKENEETEYPNPRTVKVPVTTSSGSATNLTFSIYRFVTWVNYHEGGSCTASECGATDPKRILVAVTGSDLKYPVSLITVVTDREVAQTPFAIFSSPKCEEESGGETPCLRET